MQNNYNSSIHCTVPRLVAIAIVLCAASVSATQNRKLYPVDEAAKDPTFFTFRARLIQAIQQRDANYLLSILSPKVSNDFGGGEGIADFKQKWKPERSQSEVWIELAKVLSLGGAFATDGSFSAPYLHSSWPENEGDGFEVGVIVGDNVRVRAAPQISASIIRTLSFDIVDVPDWQTTKARSEKRQWIKVKLSGGQTGYVAEEFIRSPIDYRAVFEKQNGRWVMTAFIAGD